MEYFLKGPGSFFSRLEFFSKKIQLVVLILSIIFKFALTYYYFQLENDKLQLVVAAKNFIEGHGITINTVHASNLSADDYIPLSGWPPGYSLLFSLCLLFSKNYSMCCMILDFISIACLLIVISNILTKLTVPYLLSNLLLLYLGSGFTDTVMASEPTDTPALALYLYTIYLTINFIEKKKNGTATGFLIGIISSLAFVLRYMYIPVALVIPIFLLWNGKKRKIPVLLQCGKIASTVIIPAIVLLLAFEKYYTHTPLIPTTIVPATTGFFLSNLLYLHPFIISTIFNIDFYIVQASLHTGINYSSLFSFVKLIHFILFGWLGYKVVQFILVKRGIFTGNWAIFAGLGCLSSITLILLLATLSLTHSATLNYPWEMQIWTYIMDGRYFALPMIIVLVAIVYHLFMQPALKGTALKLARTVFITVLVINILHGVYFLARHFELQKHETNSLSLQKVDQEFVKSFIVSNNARHIEVIVSGIHPNYPGFSVLQNGKGIFNASELNEPHFFAEKPSVILLISERKDFPAFSGFLQKKGVKLEKKIDKTYFISLHVPESK